MRCHSLPPSLLCHKPRESFYNRRLMARGALILDLGWMGLECHNSNGIFTINMTKLAPRPKNSSQSHAADNWLSARMQKQFCALWILYREMNYCRDFPIRWNENWTKHNNRYFLKLVLHGWWLWVPAYLAPSGVTICVCLFVCPSGPHMFTALNLHHSSSGLS